MTPRKPSRRATCRTGSNTTAGRGRPPPLRRRSRRLRRNRNPRHAEASKIGLRGATILATTATNRLHRRAALFGVVGRGAGIIAGFPYSEAFTKALTGKTWDTALLDRWLTGPQGVVPGAVMLYRQDNPEKRAQVIRYLESLH